MVTKERNSSIELLRIIAMVIIVFHHYVVHGIFDWNEMSGVSVYFLSVIQLGEWAVNIFILIFGYFSVTSDFKPARVLRLYAQVWFYSAVIFAIYTLLSKELHFGLALKAITPVISDQYWFFSRYMLLCLLMPFLNILIKAMNRQIHLRLMILLFTAWSMLPSLLPTFIGYGLSVRTTGAFVMLYIIGAYMRLYPDSRINRRSTGYTLAAGSLLLMMIIQFINLKNIIPFVGIEINFFSNSEILSVCFAVGMLSIFNSISIRSNKLINGIAACIFGVYLIHDNLYLRPLLWTVWLKNGEYLSSSHVIHRMIISVFIVFAACVLIELIRKNTVEKLWIRYCEPWLLKRLNAGHDRSGI
ncbi:MAG: acyltransferase [Clostridia bacterium]|nr:acyltransferase [Clostridia bacterium]